MHVSFHQSSRIRHVRVTNLKQLKRTTLRRRSKAYIRTTFRQNRSIVSQFEEMVHTNTCKHRQEGDLRRASTYLSEGNWAEITKNERTNTTSYRTQI